MKTLLGLLKKIKNRAGIYIGSQDISELFFFIAGYNKAIRDHDIVVDFKYDFVFNMEFQDWVYSRYDNIRPKKTWADLISFIAVDEGEAWFIFWDCLDRFLIEKSGKNLDDLIE